MTAAIVNSPRKVRNEMLVCSATRSRSSRRTRLTSRSAQRMTNGQYWWTATGLDTCPAFPGVDTGVVSVIAAASGAASGVNEPDREGDLRDVVERAEAGDARAAPLSGPHLDGGLGDRQAARARQGQRLGLGIVVRVAALEEI